MDNRLFKVIVVALLAGILCMLILFYNRQQSQPSNDQTEPTIQNI